MNIEFINGIKLTNVGIMKIGDSIIMNDESASVLIKMGFAKEVENKEPINEEKKPRKRRTKAEIEADKLNYSE